MKQSNAKALNIQGARENNLKEITLALPHDELVVVTGLSGSGKSSLAFDTVYAEGQRRYIETFSPYTRQFFDKVKKPLVDTIENVRPAVAIQQRTRITSSRSTVGSMTDVIDYLKVLWCNIAQPRCPECGVLLARWNPKDLAKSLKSERESAACPALYVVAPLTVSALPFARQELHRLTSLGYDRLLHPTSFSVVAIDELLAGDEEAVESMLHPTPQGTLELLILLQRVPKGEELPDDISTTLDQAFALADETVALVVPSDKTKALRYYRSAFVCDAHGRSVRPPRPSMFSPDHPMGACPECKGFGMVLQVSEDLCVPEPRRTINEKALHCWSAPSTRGEFRRLIKFCEKEKIPTDVPWRELPEDARIKIFEHRSREYVGVRPWFKRKERKAYKMHVRVFLSRYRSPCRCDACKGTRLKSDSLAFRVGKDTIADLWRLTIADLSSWIQRLPSHSYPREIRDVVAAIQSRLECLIALGLPYLTLDRQARTLSGGETQRVNLVAALGSNLVSTQFVLDEPSVGLHSRDTAALLRYVRELQSKGNSVLMVEHDLDCMAAADKILEMGPAAGVHGGEVTYLGTPQGWPGISLSTFKAPAFRPHRSLKVRGSSVRNLQSVDVDIPLDGFVCLSGVSGSGKSTLAHEVLKAAYDAHTKGRSSDSQLGTVAHLDEISDLVVVDQSALAKSPRANIATYSGIWDDVRTLFAATEGARLRRLSRSSFSFNVDAGRCPECKGAGFLREDMQFLSDVYLPCTTCLGKRFSSKVLEVEWNGRSVYEVLGMSVDEAAIFFQSQHRVRSALENLSLLGLGHLTLGHPLSELSGGEAQRLKLVAYVATSEKSNALLIFDEPTTGLHPHDVLRLLELFRLLVHRGHSILCIEHNLYVLAHADWIIDMGPEGGAGGGKIVASGTPVQFIDAASPTAVALRDFMQGALQSGRFAIEGDSASGRRNYLRPKNLVLRGAREHNLKNVDLDVPLQKIVAFTGLSGSGKSTIAKDIIYAEGQRRYLDCLSPYARQFVHELSKPDLDALENVQPTVCVYQHTFQPSRLSTVGTMSECYNFLRLLFAKVGAQHCPDHPDEPISHLTAADLAQEVRSYGGNEVRLLAPIVKGRKGSYRELFERAVALEISEVRVDGVFGTPSKFSEGLLKSKQHTIEYVIGKFRPKNVADDMIADAVLQTVTLGGGVMLLHSKGEDSVRSLSRTCPICQRGFFRPDPEDLSFHSKRGKCEHCEGRGQTARGAVCPHCAGDRLNALGRSVTIAGRNITAWCRETPSFIRSALAELQLSDRSAELARPVLTELHARLQLLVNFGLDYLPLDRECATLSGGELQRLRLATAIGSPLSGTMYIFDEPTAGLHPLDTARVTSEMRGLTERGNSVIVIEHDAETVANSDYIVEVGPGAGRHGGAITLCGAPSTVLSNDASLTGKWMREPYRLGEFRKRPLASDALTITNGNWNNIQALSVRLPLRRLVVFAGVSGAGKSSLLHGIITHTLNEGTVKGQRWTSTSGVLESTCAIDRLISIDQRPIGANSRSTPASYLGIWDDIRKSFAETLEAKTRGWGAGFFSYNTGKGRCPECKGTGEIVLEMSFLPEARVVCEHCNGARYTEEARVARYGGRSISEVLRLTFEEAREIFIHHRRIHHALQRVCELGLGYLALGQSSATLSGGESQRLKLATELSSPAAGHTLYVLDEPTTGLHRADVSRLTRSLQELVEIGHSVFIIEHDPDLILAADHVVEMGPGPGDLGGRIVFEGTAHQLCKSASPWGQVLKAKPPAESDLPHVSGTSSGQVAAAS